MRVGMRWTSGALCGLMILLGAAAASAQNAGKDAPTSLNFAKNLSDEDMKQRASEVITGMEATLEQTVSLAQQTQETEKDVQKLNCINDRVSVIKGFVNVSEQSRGKMVQAIAKRDRDGAEHHFTLIMIAGTKVDNLGVEARSCVGEALRYAGETLILKEISDDIAQLDPTDVASEEDVLFATEEGTPYQ